MAFRKGDGDHIQQEIWEVVVLEESGWWSHFGSSRMPRHSSNCVTREEPRCPKCGLDGSDGGKERWRRFCVQPNSRAKRRSAQTDASCPNPHGCSPSDSLLTVTKPWRQIIEQNIFNLSFFHLFLHMREDSEVTNHWIRTSWPFY